MNFRAVFFLLISVNFASPFESCDIPPNQQLIEKCCTLPEKFNIETKCGCFNIEDPVENDICEANCFINNTKAVVDGKIDKNVIKSLYKEAMESTTNLFVLKMPMDLIEDAVDKCDYEESTSNVGENLAKFYDCVEIFLRENCHFFMAEYKCIPVAEYFENCKNVTTCEAWPTFMPSSTICCDIPLIIPARVYSECHSKCTKKFFTKMKAFECIENCTIYDTKLIVEGIYDYEVAKKLLTESANDEKWNEAIEKSIETCKASYENYMAKKDSFYMGMLEYLHSCFRMHLSFNCVEFYERLECRRTKIFMAKCPGVHPKIDKPEFLGNKN